MVRLFPDLPTIVYGVVLKVVEHLLILSCSINTSSPMFTLVYLAYAAHQRVVSIDLSMPPLDLARPSRRETST